MENITIHPVAYVKNERKDPLIDNFWGEMVSEIELVNTIPAEALNGLEKVSHLEIIYFLHEIKSDHRIEYLSKPLENKNLPKTGIFAQRKKIRPNFLGSTIVKLLTRVDNKIYVQNLDAINGTPVIDIKPVYKEFLPKEKIEQPSWVSNLMLDYWEASI